MWRIVAVSITAYLMWIYNIFSFSSHLFSYPRTYKVPKIDSRTITLWVRTSYNFVTISSISCLRISFNIYISAFLDIFIPLVRIISHYPLFTLISSCFLIFLLLFPHISTFFDLFDTFLHFLHTPLKHATRLFKTFYTLDDKLHYLHP